MSDLDKYYTDQIIEFAIHEKGYGKDYFELQQRIDKAIEYIEGHDDYLYDFNGELDVLLDILKGSDKE